jgi:predicted RNA binding protein YcfA (HicA-like mRNA interferase family)
MTYSELKRELKKSGCFIHHHGSRHEIWESPITGQQFPVGRHDAQEVPKGTLGSIKKAAGLK